MTILTQAALLRYLLYASTILGFPAAEGMTLEEALLTDILGEVLLYKDPDSDVCDPKKVTGVTNIHQTIRNDNYFDDAYAEVESDMFQTEMSHQAGPDEPAENNWAIRVASGGNIYSYVGALGEVMPPNIKTGMYMVDEVWQSVAVNTTLNDFPTAPWFIHQAGVYQKEDQTAEKPYWSSPSIAKWCSVDQRECRFAGWGQQAHVPTKYSSRALYFNRYRDCGDGIMQFTSLVHNFSEETRFNYMSLPWFGVRNTVYKDVMIRRDEKDPDFATSPWITHYPNQFFGVSPRWLLPMTGGFTMFAEGREGRPEFEFPGNPYFSTAPTEKIPHWGISDLNIQGKTQPCEPDKIQSLRYNSYHMMCRLTEGTPTWSEGCKACNLEFENLNTGETVTVVNIAHYADPKDEVSQGTHMYFGILEGDVMGGRKMLDSNYVEDDAQTFVDLFLTRFKPGEVFKINWLEGKADDQNNAIAYVHGVNTEISDGIGGAQYWLGYARIEYGDANSFLRRFMVFNEVQLIKMDPGVTFGKNAFVIAGLGIDVVSEKAERVLPSTIEDYNLSGDLPYRRLDVIMKGNEFGIAVDGEGCSGPFSCTGYTTPQIDVELGRTVPFFFITFCEETYFGEDIDRYAETDNGVKRVYPLCMPKGGTRKVRPTIKLMGFFPTSNCDSVEGKTYNQNFCEENPPSADEMTFAAINSDEDVEDFCDFA